MRNLFLIILICGLFNSCQKELSVDNGVVVNLPTITTGAVTSIATTSSISGGDISSDGGATVTARGVCWDITANPIVTASHTTDGTGIGTFVSSITSLNSGTTYHVRAYATNSAGTVYGNDFSFTTLTTPGITISTLTTTAISSITTTASASGGNISSDGGAAVSARGVCWSTTPTPVVTGNHTTDGTGIGAFTSSITGLIASTVYYVRAYATNIAGTAYGNELSFTTSTPAATLPILTTTAISSITSSTASSGGNISSDGGASVTARGVCWGTTSSPVATGNHTTDGTGVGAFFSSVTGLTPSTTYYVRAYATNSVGTAYGNELNFITSALPAPDVYVGGYEGSTASTRIAKVWKNGIAISLQGIGSASDVDGLLIDNTDVYAAGSAITAISHSDPVLWKNGSLVSLPANPCGNGTSVLTSVLVSGPDLYMGGYQSQPAACGQASPVTWKNSVITYLPVDGVFPNGGEIYSIAISGSDFYAVGADNTVASPYSSKAKIWKNGVATVISSSNYASAQGIAVVGTDVYVAGYELSGSKTVATVWKNGIGTTLSNVTNDAKGNSIFVSGSDVYVAGYENLGSVQRAVVWKNGVPTYLTDGTNNAVGWSVFVYGTDVYVAGHEKSGSNFVAKYWKNGMPTVLSSPTMVSIASVIVVK